MSKPQYIHFESAQFERVTELGSEIIRVLDEDGDWRCNLPGSLAQGEIKAVISLINRAYNEGYKSGERSRSFAIARLLGVKSEALE